MRILSDYVVVYLDDLNIYFRNFNEYLKYLREVFERLRNTGLKLKAKKCQFFKKELAFLGYIIEEDRVKPDLNKVSTIKNQSVSANLKEL